MAGTLNLDAVREADLLGGAKPKVTVKTATAAVNKGGRPKGSKNDPAKSEETKLRTQLDRVLDRFAETLEGRSDDELATAIREDAKAIASGLISMTRQLTPARRLLVVLVAVAEPLLAFGRIGGILLGRWQRRRMAAMQAQAEADQAPAPDVFAPQTPDEAPGPERFVQGLRR